MTRGEAINWIINLTADIGKVEHRDLWHYEQALEEIRDMIEALPPAQHERIIGRWVKSMGMNPPEYAGRYQCSECGEWAMRDIKHFKQDLTKFCPNCGAEMRESQ